MLLIKQYSTIKSELLISRKKSIEIQKHKKTYKISTKKQKNENAPSIQNEVRVLKEK